MVSLKQQANLPDLGITAAAILDFTYDFGLGVADNGNVNRIANRHTPGRSLTFQYDELNRIKDAVTDATSGQFCWGAALRHSIRQYLYIRLRPLVQFNNHLARSESPWLSSCDNVSCH